MNIATILLLIPVIAIGNACGWFLHNFAATFYLTHKQSKCQVCGKKYRTMTLSLGMCQDCFRAQQEQHASLPLPSSSVPFDFMRTPMPDFTEDMIKLYSDPRLQKVMKKAFTPMSEKERFEAEDAEEE